MFVRHFLTILLGLCMVIVIGACDSDSDGGNPFNFDNWNYNPDSGDNGDSGDDGGSNNDSGNTVSTFTKMFRNNTSCDFVVEVELSGSIKAKRTLGPGQMYTFSENCTGNVLYYYRYYPVDQTCTGNQGGQGSSNCGSTGTVNIN